MQTDEFQTGKFKGFFNNIHEHLARYTELVFVQACGDIMMGMRVDIRIDSDRDSCDLAALDCQLADYLKLRNTLHIEALYTIFETKFNFAIALSHTGKYNIAGSETALESPTYFTTAHRIHTEAGIADFFEHNGVGVGLDRIMDLKSRIDAFGLPEILQSTTQQCQVVVIKRSPGIIEFFYWKHICALLEKRAPFPMVEKSARLYIIT